MARGTFVRETRIGGIVIRSFHDGGAESGSADDADAAELFEGDRDRETRRQGEGETG